MASECFYGQFSAKTDVWAFGATMWEVFELAKHEPYWEMGDREVVQDACKRQDRALLTCPAACPQAVYEVMLQCWLHTSEPPSKNSKKCCHVCSCHAFKPHPLLPYFPSLLILSVQFNYGIVCILFFCKLLVCLRFFLNIIVQYTVRSCIQYANNIIQCRCLYMNGFYF